MPRGRGCAGRVATTSPGVTRKSTGRSCGSIVTRSVPSMTMVQGNPARPIARCEVPLTFGSSFREFLFRLKPIPGRTSDPARPDD